MSMISWFQRHPYRDYFVKHKKRILIASVAFLGFFAVAVSGYFDAEENQNPEQEERAKQVEYIDLDEYREEMRIVQAAGQVEALNQVELKSEVSARVTYVGISLGSKVRAGQVIARFNAGSLAAQLQQARADLEGLQASKKQLEAAVAAQEATLADLKRGAKPEEVQVAQTQIIKAEQDLTNQYNKVKTLLKETHRTTQEVIYQHVDDFFRNPRSGDPALIFGTKDQSLMISIHAQRRRIETMLPEWLGGVDAITAFTSQSALDAELEASIVYATQVRALLDDMVRAVIDARGISDSTKSSYLPVLDAQTSVMNGMISGIENQQNQIASQKLVVEQAKDQLAVVQSGASQDRVDAQAAAVAQARANLEGHESSIKRAYGVINGIQAELAKTAVRSPISGTVATLDAKVGELMSPGAMVATVVNTNGLQVKAYIDSNDLWMVKKGAKARVNDRFDGEVINVSPSIDPATKKVEVIVVMEQPENGATLPVVGQFVDVVIVSGIQEGETETPQIRLPLSAIYSEADAAYIFTVNAENRVERLPVELGNLVGVEVEVKSDLSDVGVILSSVRGISVGDLVELRD